MDSSTAYSLCMTLKNFAKVSGKTVVMTIHQPSSQIFNMFDKVRSKESKFKASCYRTLEIKHAKVHPNPTMRYVLNFVHSALIISFHQISLL